MEIMRGKEGMKILPLQTELGGTAACTVRISAGGKQPHSEKTLAWEMPGLAVSNVPRKLLRED